MSVDISRLVSVASVIDLGKSDNIRQLSISARSAVACIALEQSVVVGRADDNDYDNEKGNWNKTDCIDNR